MRINQSRLAIYDDCHRKYYWLFEENLAPPRPETYFEVGKAIHEALANVESGRPEADSIAAAEETLRAGLAQGLQLPGDDARADAAAAQVRSLLTGYFKAHGASPWTTMATEVYGSIPLVTGPPHIALHFRVDKVVNWRNHLWLVDHKTASKLDLRQLSSYADSRQFILYCIGAEQALGHPIAGMIADILVKTTVPQYHRELYLYDTQKRRDVLRETIEIAKEIQHRQFRVTEGEDPLTVFYRNRQACRRFGNCPFISLCENPNEFNRQLYTTRTPDYVDTPPVPVDRHAGRTGDTGRQDHSA